MRIVIMADGKGMRWDNHLGIPKHFALVNGEKLISRTIRLLNAHECSHEFEVIVTSHDKRYEFAGSKRYEPLDNKYEIDRFTAELIQDDMCFLYGDTYYTEDTLNQILDTEVMDILFFGNRKSIVGIRIKKSEIFKEHLNRVKRLYLAGKIKQCAGWQVYQSFVGQGFETPIEIKEKFVLVDDRTTDVNFPCDYEALKL